MLSLTVQLVQLMVGSCILCVLVVFLVVLNLQSLSFPEKEFYALNVQCIADDKKRVLWMSYSHKGASHDSSCLRETQLDDKLISMKTK